MLEKMTKAQIISEYAKLNDKLEEVAGGYYSQKQELEHLRGTAIEKDGIEQRIAELDMKVREANEVNKNMGKHIEAQQLVVNDLRLVVVNQSVALASIAGMKRVELSSQQD